MDGIKLNALAKINLGLDVIARREDGYHEVRMVMQTINLYDQIYIHKSDQPGIRLNTNLPYLPVNENNLVYKASMLLMDEFQIEQGIEIELEKHIPVAAGMAGGSSDAAATLVGINRLYKLKLSKKELMKRAVKLGADVPYCVMRGTALSEGIGEILTPLPSAPRCYVLIARPGINVSTKFVYENLDIKKLRKHPDIDGMIQAVAVQDLLGVAERLCNVLETVTIREYPVIEQLKQEMLQAGALNAIMSGSGPTVFGLFNNKKAADSAFCQLKNMEEAKQVYLTDFFNRKKG